mmetsp:Transcript_17885/g.42321  ORF Transcript_17885/g.42321 Transcript_17885/m.42321 type:complete len:219 (+) Transcript_17885:1905-2561(+)
MRCARLQGVAALHADVGCFQPELDVLPRLERDVDLDSHGDGVDVGLERRGFGDGRPRSDDFRDREGGEHRPRRVRPRNLLGDDGDADRRGGLGRGGVAEHEGDPDEVERFDRPVDLHLEGAVAEDPREAGRGPIRVPHRAADLAVGRVDARDGEGVGGGRGRREVRDPDHRRLGVLAAEECEAHSGELRLVQHHLVVPDDPHAPSPSVDGWPARGREG